MQRRFTNPVQLYAILVVAEHDRRHLTRRFVSGLSFLHLTLIQVIMWLTHHGAALPIPTWLTSQTRLVRIAVRASGYIGSHT
jgi:hypothetical protein